MKSLYVRAPAAVVIRVEATIAYVAQALAALGDTDSEDERRVKAVLLLANPTQAVELLAAYAAHRARSRVDEDVPLPDCDAPTSTEPPSAASEPGSDDVRVPQRFRPDALPAWLRRAADPEHRWRWDWTALLPRANIWLHLARETLEQDATGPPGGVVRWEGEGPVTLAYVREQIAPYHAVTVRPVLDLAGQEPVDSYEIPQRHRHAVHLRTPADCFPFAAQVGSALDIDHTEPFEHAPTAGAGQSRMDNYGPLGRLHHRIKTHGRWQVRQPFDGVYVWRDPHGHHYVVDHTGTRTLDRPPRTPRPRTARAHVIEIYRRDDVEVAYVGTTAA